MPSDPPSSNGSVSPGALPPVEPPNPRFIAQLFLIPGLLVAVVVGFIWIFFGWLGTSTQDADTLLMLVETSPSDTQRWKAAQDLAQLLPRDQDLRCNMRFALKMTETLQRERQRPAPPAQDENVKREQAPDLLEFLPAAVAHFHAPVGLPLLQAIVADNVDKVSDKVALLRLRNAIVAIGIMGAKVQEYDSLPVEKKGQMLATLRQEAGGGPGRPTWARLALAYLTLRDQRSSNAGKTDATEPYGIVETLRLGARAADELTRKYTVSALANWDEPKVDPLLRQLAGDQGDLPDSAFEKDEKEPFTEQDRARGEREIRYNAALALARRGSPLTPWHTVLEILDEDALRKQYVGFAAGRSYGNEVNAANMATQCIAKALRDLHELRRTNRKVWDEQKDVQEAVQRLAERGSSMVVRVEAEKLMSGAPDGGIAGGRMSREVLLIVGLGVGVLLLLALAAIARWRRKPLESVVSGQ